jgi:hypothetical protein
MKPSGNMDVIIYTEDFEPINMISLPREVLDKAERTGRVRIGTGKPDGLGGFHTLDIYCVRVLWVDNNYKPVLVTPDEELLLEALPHWMPGQRSVIQSYQQQIKDLTNKLIKAMRK